MRSIICDAGPILHLAEAELSWLLGAAGKVYCPRAVATELERLQPEWPLLAGIEVLELSESAQSRATALQNDKGLHLGEAEALALSEELGVNWFLTDDNAARLAAREASLEVHGSLGILLWAAVEGHLDYAAARSGLKRLSQSTLWLSKAIEREVHDALDQIFRRS
ncbi:MAG: hypothetical protein AAGD38_17185 [Acidobacteriota bacterium]